jgi:hypothetical protein
VVSLCGLVPILESTNNDFTHAFGSRPVLKWATSPQQYVFWCGLDPGIRRRMRRMVIRRRRFAPNQIRCAGSNFFFPVCCHSLVSFGLRDCLLHFIPVYSSTFLQRPVQQRLSNKQQQRWLLSAYLAFLFVMDSCAFMHASPSDTQCASPFCVLQGQQFPSYSHSRSLDLHPTYR